MYYLMFFIFGIEKSGQIIFRTLHVSKTKRSNTDRGKFSRKSAAAKSIPRTFR